MTLQPNGSNDRLRVKLDKSLFSENRPANLVSLSIVANNVRTQSGGDTNEFDHPCVIGAGTQQLIPIPPEAGHSLPGDHIKVRDSALVIFHLHEIGTRPSEF
jgi:hypothetical protein